MNYVDGKEVVFHTNFFVSHKSQALVIAPIGNVSVKMRFAFAPLSSAQERLTWATDADGTIQFTMGTGEPYSFQMDPAKIGTAFDGSDLFLQFIRTDIGAASLVHLYLLKGGNAVP